MKEIKFDYCGDSYTVKFDNSGSNYFFDEETRKALQRASEILNKDLEGMMGSNSGGNMENKQDCTKVYSIKGYAVQDNGIVRNSYGEYIGQLSDLEECEARGKEIASLTGQVAKLKEDRYLVIPAQKGSLIEQSIIDENKVLKKQLEEIEKSAYGLVIEDMHSSSKFAKVLTKAEFAKRVGRKIDAMQEKIPKLESQLKAKDDLLEKMREALEDIKNNEVGLRSNIINSYSWSLANGALALLSKSLPKPLNKEVKGSEK